MDRRFKPVVSAAAAALAALILAGCELGPTDATDSVSVSSRSDNGQCPSPSTLRSGGGPGEACAVSGDCAEVCCSCSTTGNGFAAAACVNSLCALNQTSCQKAEESRPSVCE